MKKITMILVFVLMSLQVFSQIEVKYFNAEWNKANDISWVSKLSDCDIEKYDIGANPADAGKFKVVVVPTILIFQDGEEVERYQADLSFKMSATREEVQDYIDELVMSAF
tara:strand:+ start:497 stop:826 length:330 start_codon:yes stop_codon:yes gene_type:complete